MSAGVVCALLCPLAAWAAPVSLQLVAGPEGGPLRPGAVNVRLNQPVQICAVVQLRGRVFSDGRLHRQRPARSTSALGATPTWRWYRVEPRPHHLETAPPNPGNPAYSNAVLFGPHHGKWRGYDHIEYHETLLSGASASCITVHRSHPTHPRVDVNGGLGTMRYKATLQVGALDLTSPGMESAGRTGISPRVMRVTFRAGDDLVGYLKGFFNVPNVFGSGGAGRRHQTELYQGADCADVIIGAAREAGVPLAYTSVLGFRRHARPVSDRLLMTRTGLSVADGPDRGKAVTLRFGQEVQAGDIMLIDYVGFEGSPRGWDHIAVLDRDVGVRGVLDPNDPVLHMGYLYGLTEEPAASQAPAAIQLLRFSPRVLRKLQRGHLTQR